jgi:hypothetical protein
LELIEAELKSKVRDLWPKKVFTKKKKGNDGRLSRLFKRLKDEDGDGGSEQLADFCLPVRG